MASVVFDNVVKQYNKKAVILKGISLTIKDGEFLVLVGPSGCGKSTLLRTLAGLETITSGTIKIGDKIVNKLKPKDRNIAMVFQSYALYPHMTARENISFGLKVRKTEKSEIKRRVDEVAKMLDIENLLDRFPKEMSGGQRQRVAMGRAVVRNPEVFLFDEPLSNLDANLRTLMRAELKKLHKKLKTTVVYVTHDQVEAMTLANRIVVLNQGIIQQIGTPKELFETPQNVFVAKFIGSPSMNIFNISSKNGFLERKNVKIALKNEKIAQKEKILLGIRPQDFKVSQNKGELEGTIEIIESLGHRSLLHITISQDLKIETDLLSETIADKKEGDKIFLNTIPEKLHFFDIQTEKRI